jgi:hypothetical protein
MNLIIGGKGRPEKAVGVSIVEEAKTPRVSVDRFPV